MADERQLMEDGSRRFPTREAAERLKDIGRWEPALRGDQFMAELCEILGKRIGSHHQIVVSGFPTAFLLVVEDAKRGKDGFTDGPMPAGLTKQHPLIYHAAVQLMAVVARAAFGAEFGELVEAQVKDLGV